ncbi:MAG TPA: adenylate/guanylate cyclase domain-containing protein [Acidimicrobiia bacterium]
MAQLSAKQRAELPNSAFAYVDSQGRRLLPINDEPHVRNALSRFNQVKFEDEAAKERAFRKLLTAATKYGIAPIGFVARQLREAAAGESPAELPSGPVTLLLSDIEGSTGLVHRLGEAYPELLAMVQGVIREAVDSHRGYEVDARADEFFAAFANAADAVRAALAIQRSLRDLQSGEKPSARVRIGVHSGSPARTETGYVGLPVNTAARVCNAGHGGQILISGTTRDELSTPGVDLVGLGAFDLRGLPRPVELFQVTVPDLPQEFPPPRV